MLAGREDVAPLAYYAKNMLNYSDDGHTLNGAYGYRWRHADTSVEPRDQLEIIVEHLQNKPESRRAVLTMWDVEDDLMQIDESV
jgi:thymidylate synthase